MNNKILNNVLDHLIEANNEWDKNSDAWKRFCNNEITLPEYWEESEKERTTLIDMFTRKVNWMNYCP
jgi:hypothetical protein